MTPTPCNETFCECSRCRPEAQQSAVRDVWPDAKLAEAMIVEASVFEPCHAMVEILLARVRELEAELRRARG